MEVRSRFTAQAPANLHLPSADDMKVKPKHLDFLDVAYRDLTHVLIGFSCLTSVLSIIQGAIDIHHYIYFDDGGNSTCISNRQKDIAIATIFYACFTIFIAVLLSCRAIYLISIGLLNIPS